MKQNDISAVVVFNLVLAIICAGASVSLLYTGNRGPAVFFGFAALLSGFGATCVLTGEPIRLRVGRWGLELARRTSQLVDKLALDPSPDRSYFAREEDFTARMAADIDIGYSWPQWLKTTLIVLLFLAGMVVWAIFGGAHLLN